MNKNFMYEARVQNLLNEIVDRYQEILGDNMVGIYLYGSLTFGCFLWEQSDIDFIVLTEHDLYQEEKEAVIRVLLSMEDKEPNKGFEMSIVQKKVCCPFVYPTPFVLHFSKLHREACKRDLKAYCEKMHGVDRDLAAHFTMIRKNGIALVGEEISSVFGEVPASMYWDSICSDVKNATGEIQENPVYVILNLCRVLAYKKDGLILSKCEGAAWGEEMLPGYSKLIRKAGNIYAGIGKENFQMEKLDEFSRYMLEQIFSK